MANESKINRGVFSFNNVNQEVDMPLYAFALNCSRMKQSGITHTVICNCPPHNSERLGGTYLSRRKPSKTLNLGRKLWPLLQFNQAYI